MKAARISNDSDVPCARITVKSGDTVLFEETRDFWLPFPLI